MADYSRLSKEQLDAIIAAEGDTSRMDPEIVSGISKSLYGYTPPEPEGQGAFGSGIDRMQASVQTAGATVADRVGLAALSKSLQDSAEANKKEAATWRPDIESYRDIGGVGDAATFVKEQALSNLPYIGGVLGAGALGVAAAPAAVPAAAAALAGSAAFTFPIFVGSNIDRQMEEMGVDINQTDLTKASATAAAQTALEVTIDRFLPGVGKAISRAGGFKVIPSLARNSVEAGVVEGLTESGQQALEILQANPEKLFSMERETADEIINAAIAGVALGGALGGTMGTIRDAQAARDAQELEGEYERLRQELGTRQRGTNKGFEEYVDEQMKLAAEIAAAKEQETKQDSEELSNLLPPPSATSRRRDTPEVDPNNVPEEELEIVQTDDGFSVRGKESGIFHKGRMRTREEAQTYKANLEDEIANRFLSNKIYEAIQDGDFDTARNTLEAAKAEPGKYSAEQVDSEFRKLEAAENALNQVLAPINGRIAVAEESLVDFKGSKTSSVYKALEENLASLKAQRGAVVRKMAEKQGPFVPPPASREPIDTDRPNLTRSRDIPYAERTSDIQTTYEVREVPVKGRSSKSRVYRISKKGKKIPLKGEMDAEQAVRYRESLERKYKGTKYVVEETKNAEPSFVLFKQERNSAGDMLGEDAVDSFSTEQEARQKAQEASGISQRMQDQPPAPTQSQQHTVSLRKLYSKLLGQDGNVLPDALRVEASEVLLDPEGSPVEGIVKTTQAGEILVRIASRLNPAFNEKEALDAVLGVGRHEFIHVLRELNVLTPEEWGVLTQAVREIKRPGYNRLSLLDSIQDQYRDVYNFDDAGNPVPPEQKAELLEEEAVAELFRMWAQNPAILKSNPKADGIIAKIVKWLMGIKDSPDIKELANRVLTDIESGEVGARYVPPKRPGKGVATAPQPATYTNEAGESYPIEGYDQDGNRLFSRMSVANPGFKKWFGDSKLVNEDGTPKVMYHGTSKDKDFKSFSKNLRGNFFTENADDASSYAMENDSQRFVQGSGWSIEKVNTASRVLPVYLSIQNPKVLSESELDWYQVQSSYAQAQKTLTRRAINEGHDGIYWGGGVWSTVDPKQIKSIFNEFNEGVDSIARFSKAGNDTLNPVRGKNNSPFVGSAKLPDGKYNVELLFGQHSDDPVATGMSNFGARHILAKHGSEIAEATGQKNILKVIESFLTAINSGHRGITDITSRGDTKVFKWERKDFKWPIVIHFFKRGDNKLSLATMFPKQYGEDRFESRIKDIGASQEDIAQFRANRIVKEITGPKYSIGFKSYHVVDRPELQRTLKDGRFNVYLDIYEDGKRDGYDDPFAYIQMAIDEYGRAEVSTFPYGRMKPNVAGVRAVKEIIKQVKKLYPDINEMFGERVTGSRGIGADSFERFARGEITEQQYEELTTQRIDVSKYSLGIKIDGSDAVYNAAARIFNPSPEMTIWQSVLKRAFGVEYDKGDTLGRAIVRNFAHNQLGSFIFDKQYRDMMIGMGSMPDKMLSGKMLELATQMAGRSEALVHFGPLTYDRGTGEVGISEDVEGLADIFSALDPEATINVNGTPISEVQAYGAYAVANRERDLRSNGRIGFIDLSNAEIDEIINSAPSHFKEVFEKHQSFNEKLIDFAVETELISPELRDNLLSMSYIPFYRKIDKDAENPAYHGYSFSSRLSESLNNPKALTKELIGGEQNIQEDILEMIGRNAISIVKSGLSNQALIRTAEQIDKLNEIVEGPPQWGYRVDKPEDGGMNMVFRKGGEEVIYKIVAPDLWYSLISLQPQQVNGVVAVMSNFTNILRQGITHFPGYMLANLWRGKFEGYVKAGIPLTSVGQSFSKMKEVLKNDPSSMAIALKVETGMGGYNLGHMRYNLQGLPESGMTRALKRELRNKRRESGSATYDWATTTQDRLANFWEMTTRVGEATELAERLVLAERLMEQGVPKKEAMWQALNLINYGRKGAGGSQDSGWIPMAFMNLIPMVPFLNSRIQGLYRMWENPEYQKASWATLGFPSDMFMRGLLLVAIEAGLWSIFSNDERWDEERLDRKVNYNILYAGDNTIYLPRAFEIGAIFGAFPGLTLDAIKQRDGEELAAGTAQIFLNTLSFNPIPQGVKPVMETWMNFNTFTGRPLESTAQQRMLAEDRYNSRTSYIARMIGNATGSSPIKIDHLITGYLGSLGGAMLATVDTLGQAAGGFPTRPDGLFGNAAFFDPVLGDVIGLSRFIRSDDQRANKFIGEFYDLKKEIGEIHSSSQEAMLRGQVDYAQELISDNKKKLALRIPINRVAKRLGDINRSIRKISNDPNMSSGDKRRKLARLRKQKDELARRLVEMVKKAGGA
jgi:hypothetical protein